MKKAALTTDSRRNKPLKTVNIDADMTVLYSSIAQLAKNSDLIVWGKVDYVDWNTVQYTKVSMEVTKTFSSGAKKGDIITVLDEGGITTQAAIIRDTGNKFGETIGPKEENTKVQVLFEGAPLAKVGDEAVYFLAVGDLPIIPGKFYGPIGAYQGKFNITSGIAERYVPRGDETSKYNNMRKSATILDTEITDAPKKP
jgi:hypothetical protein